MRKTADTNIQRVAVVGTGLMGHGIAQCFAVNGFAVTLLSRNKRNLEKAFQNIEWSLTKFVKKGIMTQDEKATTLSRIKTSDTYERGLMDVDLVVESVSEDMRLKKKIFSKIDKLAPSHAIIASNTSALSVTDIGRATKRPQKTVGMHWFIPPQLIPLIEVIKGNDTSPETLNATLNLSKKLGKTPILCKKDARGFIVSRILVSMFNEAFSTFTRKEASLKEIDSSVKYCGGFPMGLFELVDFVGLDIENNVSKILYEAHGERFYPHLGVTKPLIASNNLGKKTGQGFYDWSKGRPKIPEKIKGKYDVGRSWAVAVNEAAWIVFDGVAEPKSIDLGMKLGTGWSFGPCEYGDLQGLDKILETLESAYDEFTIDLYQPCPLLKEYAENGWTGTKTKKGFYTYF